VARPKSEDKRNAILDAATRLFAERGLTAAPTSEISKQAGVVPVRLILGVDAEQRVQQAEAARASEAEKFRHLTVSTVFEDGRFDRRLYTAKS
jgi:hypothetical protein